MVWMVDIRRIEKNFRRFQGSFCEDIIDLNIDGRIEFDRVKTRMIQSELFKSIQDFAKERKWDIESRDLKILARRGENIIDISPVESDDRKTLHITPWSQFQEKLKRIDELTED